MGLFDFLSKNEEELPLPTELEKPAFVCLRHRDSPVQFKDDSESSKQAILSAIQNIAHGEIKAIKTGFTSLGSLGSLLFFAEKIGFEIVSDTHQFVTINKAIPVADVDLMIDTLEVDGLPIIARLTINKDMKFAYADTCEFDSEYTFLIVGYNYTEEAFTLKAFKGASFGDEGYIYISKDDLSSAKKQCYVITGLNYK